MAVSVMNYLLNIYMCVYCTVFTYNKWLVYGDLRHFQQYFSYIVAVSLLVEETGVLGENHRPAVSH
jgi:hypothetical protein